MNESSENFRVRHQALSQRGVHDLPHEVRVAHHARLDLLLHLHEVGGTHPEVRKAGETAQTAKAERCLADIFKKLTV